MDISEYPKFSANKVERDVSKMQVISVSEELQDRLGNSMNETISNPGTSGSQHQKESSLTLPSQSMEISKEKPSVNYDPSQAPQKKAKLLRIERKRNKLLAQGKSPEEIETLMKKKKPQNTGKTLDDFFKEISNCSNKLEV